MKLRRRSSDPVSDPSTRTARMQQRTTVPRHDARPLSPVGATMLVMRREYGTRVREKSFLVSTAVTVAALVALVVIRSFTGDGPDTRTIGVIGPSGPVQQQLESSAQSVGAKFRVRSVDSRAAGESSLRSGDLDVLLTTTGPTGTGDVDIVVRRDLPEETERALTAYAQQRAGTSALAGSGVDAAEYQQTVASAGVQVDRIETPVANQGERYAIGFIAALLIYIGLIMYGTMVAQGVVEEKSNRIVELLLTAIRPWQLMLGKVLGIGAIGMTQLAIVTTSAVAVAVGLDVLDLPSSVLLGSVAWAIVWFVVGYVSFALLFAALGALVSRQEEVGSVTAPATTLLVVPYVLAVTVIRPDEELARWAEWLSMVPLFAPIMMPMRAAIGAPQWQLWTALGLSLLTMSALVWLAGRVYGSAVLRTGTRVGVLTALRRT